MSLASARSEPSAPASAVPPVVPYLDALSAALLRARTANGESLVAASGIVEDTVARGGVVYVFGSGHSQLAALELSRRAGGLAPLQVILDPTWGMAEEIDGFGEALVASLGFEPPDCLLVVSNSGLTAAPIEVARAARTSGLPVIAVTSMATFREASADHLGCGKLHELADVVLDNGAVGADAAVRVEHLDLALGPTSTVVAAALLHEVVVSAIAGLVRRGLEPPVLQANAEAGGREHNAMLLDRYRGRLQRVP